MKILKEFKEFIQEYKVMGLAVAFIMGAAVNELVKSFVENMFMPTITPFIPDGGWKTFTVALGPIFWGIGPFLGALLNFLCLAFVVFLMVKLYTHGDKK